MENLGDGFTLMEGLLTIKGQKPLSGFLMTPEPGSDRVTKGEEVGFKKPGRGRI